MNNLTFWRPGRDELQRNLGTLKSSAAMQGVRRAAVRALQAVNTLAGRLAGRPPWSAKMFKLFVYVPLFCAA